MSIKLLMYAFMSFSTLQSSVILKSTLCSNVTVNIYVQAHSVMNDIILKYCLYRQIKDKSLG